VVRGLSCAAIACAFERPAAFEISRDAGGAEHVAAELLLEAGVGGAPADPAVGIDAVHRARGEGVASANRRPEKGSLAVIANPGSNNLKIQPDVCLDRPRTPQ